MKSKSVRAIGIDPGTDRIGYGVVDLSTGKLSLVSSGVLAVRKTKDYGFLFLSIESALRKIIKKTHPEVGGVETLFFSKNKTTAMRVAEARGVIIKTLSEFGISGQDISPMEVKLSIGGHGKADKRDVSRMAGKLLGTDLAGKIDDETDAIAIAIVACFKAKKQG